MPGTRRSPAPAFDDARWRSRRPDRPPRSVGSSPQAPDWGGGTCASKAGTATGGSCTPVDASGAEVHRALAALLTSPVEILDHAIALDLVTDEAGNVAGISVLPEEPPKFLVFARAVVIAAGGLGQAFSTTSNPAGATGDGIAIAARAGAVLRDLEFVQFHPTVLYGGDATGQRPLITEALRGAGAVLRDLDGKPVMTGRHPRGDLAPRDIVAAAMHEVMERESAGHLWLDATALGRHCEELPDRHGGLPSAARRPGDGPHPGRARRALLLWWHSRWHGRADEHSRSLRGGRGRQHRRARRQPAGLQLPGRGGDHGPERGGVGDQGSQQARSAVCRAQSRRLRAGRRACGESGRASSRDVPVRGRRARPGRASRASPGRHTMPATTMPATTMPAATAPGGHVRGQGADLYLDRELVETANLHAVSVLIAAAGLARTKSRGCHRRRDFPKTWPEARHTLIRWTPDGLKVEQL